MFEAEYLIKREQQELEAAQRASDARVRQVHLELADAYTVRVNEARRREQPIELTPPKARLGG